MSAEHPVSHEVDLLIVGAGPTGLFAAYYAGFRGLSVVLVDALPEPGGQVTAMYPEKMIFDVAGFPEIRGRDLVKGLVEQANQYDPLYLLGRNADELTNTDDGVVVGLGAEQVRASAVLITAGIGEFTPRPLPAGGDWLGRGVVHFIPELGVHSGHDVVVIGGGDSAFDWALALHPVANGVTLVHRRARFRAHAGLVNKVRELGVPLITDAEVAEIRGDDSGVYEVEIEFNGGAGRRVLPARTVVAALGFTASLGPIESWELDLEKRSILVDTTMRTNRDRVYAAGDVAAYPGKVKLIATGFGEAATAVNNIAVEINPDARLFPGHSTNKG